MAGVVESARGERAGILSLYAAKIEATLRRVPLHERDAAVRALIEQRDAEVRGLEERKQAAIRAARANASLGRPLSRKRPRRVRPS